LIPGVEHKRGSANCRVEVACSKALERKPSNCRVPLPGGEAKEGLLPLSGVEAWIPAVRRGEDRLRVLDERKTDNANVIRTGGVRVFISREFRKNLASLSRLFAASTDQTGRRNRTTTPCVKPDTLLKLTN